MDGLHPLNRQVSVLRQSPVLVGGHAMWHLGWSKWQIWSNWSKGRSGVKCISYHDHGWQKGITNTCQWKMCVSSVWFMKVSKKYQKVSNYFSLLTSCPPKLSIVRAQGLLQIIPKILWSGSCEWVFCRSCWKKLYHSIHVWYIHLYHKIRPNVGRYTSPMDWVDLFCEWSYIMNNFRFFSSFWRSLTCRNAPHGTS